MTGSILGSDVTQADLRLKLLSFGMNHPYRVVNLDEISASIGNSDKEMVKKVLEFMSAEGLVTRFSGRFCFNRPIPSDLRKMVEKASPLSRVTTAIG